LVDDHQIMILVQDLDLERNVRLDGRLAVIPDELLCIERGVTSERRAVEGDDLAAVEAREQPLWIEMEESLDHVGAGGGPGAGARQVQAGGADPVADGQWRSH